MDQSIQDPVPASLPAAPAPVDRPGPAAWTAPAWCAGLAGRLVARLGARAPVPPGLEHAHAEAGAAGAMLLVNVRDLARVGARLRGRVTFLIDAAPAFDGLARMCASFGSPVVRCGPGQGQRDVPGARDVVRALVVMPGALGIARALDLIAALGRRVIPLSLARPDRPLTWRTGIGAPVDLNIAGTEAQLGQLSAAHASGPGRAQMLGRIERLMDDAAAPRAAAPMARRRGRRPLALAVYAAAMGVLTLVALPYLLARVRAGREEFRRVGERRGRSRTPRPDGRVIWFHAASVGESLSVLPLIGEIGARWRAATVLLTTGTVTSARLVGSRTGAALIHQFFPLDAPRYARRFLDHWRPDAAIFVESELWPNMMAEIARRHLPFATVNGRLSARSLALWRRWPGAARCVLGALDLVLAQSSEHARRFALLGARDVRHIGNLKFDCPAPPASPGEVETLRRLIGERRLWLAASTHQGEEAFVAEAHFAIRERFPDLLTVIVPRHPARGTEIAKHLEDRWLVPARRSQAEEISPKTDVYLADTLGELGLFYRLAPIAFVGGSLVPVGGHNPIEPAQLDCVVVHGPHVHNFADTYAALDGLGGAVGIATSGELAREVTDLLSNQARCRALNAASRAEIGRNEGSLERALEALAPHLAS